MFIWISFDFEEHQYGYYCLPSSVLFSLTVYGVQFFFICFLRFLFHLCIHLLGQELIKKAGHALSNWVYLGGVKAFADGSLGSNSALFYEVRQSNGNMNFPLIIQLFE